jgi:hypothetical protein
MSEVCENSKVKAAKDDSTPERITRSIYSNDLIDYVEQWTHGYAECQAREVALKKTDDVKDNLGNGGCYQAEPQFWIV